MQFCKECENKLFPIEEDSQLWNKCIDCGFKEEYNDSIIDKKNYKSQTDRHQKQEEQLTQITIMQNAFLMIFLSFAKRKMCYRC